MKKVKFIAGIESYTGTLDTKKEGQAKRQRLVSRFRPGTKGHQMYSMSIHEGPWSEGVTSNRELMKTAQREAHAIERAAKHPDLSTPEYINLANEWQQHFAAYKAAKRPEDKQYTSLYTYTYSCLYRELKAGKILDIQKANADAKASLYQTLVPQIQSLIDGESDLIANMANIAAALHNTFRFWWTGFYLVNAKAKANAKANAAPALVLGPFQGPVACTRIPYGKGVCGTAWAQDRTIIVPDVHHFPGHIACSSESKSEIVVPIRKNGDIIAVLDIDSADYNTFDAVDKTYLEQITCLL